MGLFRKEAIEAKRRKLHGDVILVQPVRFYVMSALFFTIVLAGVIYAASRDYTRKETALGFIAPSSGLTTIRADRGGLITSVFVIEGEHVNVGDPLFESRVDVETDGGFVSERRLVSADERINDLQDRKRRTRENFAAETDRLRSSISGLEREVAALSKRQNLERRVRDIADVRLTRFERLLAEDTVSQLEYDQVEFQAFQARISLQAVEQQYVARTSALQDARFQLAALPRDEQRQIADIDAEIASLRDSRTAIEAQSRYIVRAPVAGELSGLQARAGRTVDPALTLATIIPENSPMEARLLVPPAAVGFVEPGQPVNILLDAFPYQKFGAVHGEVTSLSRTPFRPGELSSPIVFEQSIYQVRVRLDDPYIEAYGERVLLKPGMTLQGDVVTDTRSLLEWMFDPLFALRRN